MIQKCSKMFKNTVKIPKNTKLSDKNTIRTKVSAVRKEELAKPR